MKKYLSLILFLISLASFAQTPTFNNIKVLGDSTTGLSNGRIYYNATSNKFRFRQNGAWVSLGSGGGGGSGTVTSVGIATGTSGTDFNVSGSPVTTSGNITLNFPSSSASNRGLLLAADWSTFNGKQNAITFGTGVQTALGVNVGSAGAPVLFNGAGGTPSAITLTNGTGLPGATGITGQITTSNLPLPYIRDQASPSTAGGTITLDMNSQIWRSHVGSATFSAPKTVAMSNTTNSLNFVFMFEITDVAAVLTLPSDWALSVYDWNGTTWTPPDEGKWKMSGEFDDVNNVWEVDVTGPKNQ